MIAGIAVARLRLSNTQLCPFRSPGLQPQASLPSTRRVALSRCATRISPSTCGEMLNRALHPIARAIGPYRVHGVVVRRPRRKVLHAHAENGIGMAWVQPDWRLRGLAEVLGIRTVMHHSVVFGRASRVLACPPDNDQVGPGRLELRSLRDPDPRGFCSSWAHLRGAWGQVKYATYQKHHGQFQKQSI